MYFQIEKSLIFKILEYNTIINNFNIANIELASINMSKF